MKHYFTFGFGQPHENGFHVIEADTAYEARLEMVKRFDWKWSMQYSGKDWFRNGKSQQEECGLHEVK